MGGAVVDKRELKRKLAQSTSIVLMEERETSGLAQSTSIVLIEEGETSGVALKNLGTPGLGSRRLAGWNTKKGSCPISTHSSHLCPTSHIPTEPQALVHHDPSDRPSPSSPEGLLQAMTLACSLFLQTGKTMSWQREPIASMSVLLLGPNKIPNKNTWPPPLYK